MHPWIWLNEPQHSGAVQALTGIFSTIAAVVAGVFAVGAYHAANAQARSAGEQTDIARQQAKLANDRYMEEQKINLQERSKRDIQERARQKRLFAKEDAERPRWEVHHMALLHGQPSHETRLTNGGRTAALNIRCLAIDRVSSRITKPYCQPESSVHVPINPGDQPPREFLLRFGTIFGSQWLVSLLEKDGIWSEEVMSTSRLYDVNFEDFE